MPLRTAGRANPWQMLVAAMVAQVTATAVVSTPLLLIPHLHLEEGWPLVAGATLAAAPTIGTLATLVAWGALVDRLGERISLLTGLTVLVAGAAVTVIGARAGSTLALGLGFALCGVAAASSNSASGRLVVGWFPAHRRGVAMGIRQTGLPLGVGVAALVVPAWVDTHGIESATWLCLGAAAIAAIVVGATVVDPPGGSLGDPGAGRNPYRLDHRLARIHAVSALLVVPQYVVWTFMLLWLIDHHGWSVAAAGALYGASQGLGAAGRIAVGWWSDRAGTRLGPIRTIAADNGLAFTAVAEIAGPRWAGRAFGIQNTGQYLTAAAVPPVAGLLIQHCGYGWTFAAVALFAAAAVPLVPRPTDG